jgi:hypothetical protein
VKKSKRSHPVAESLHDVCDHLSEMRRYYFEVVSASPEEINVTIRPKDTRAPVGFRSRRK